VTAGRIDRMLRVPSRLHYDDSNPNPRKEGLSIMAKGQIKTAKTNKPKLTVAQKKEKKKAKGK
jgi:hypothetical protein